MSFYYTRIPKQEEKVEGWGFKKVNSAELTGILERVTRPTYNSRMQNMECTQVHNYRYGQNNVLARRSPTYCHRRHSASAVPLTPERRLNDRELQRLVRRITKPTVCSEISRYDYIEEEELLPAVGRPKSAPDYAEERQKALINLSRPTTASRAKTLGDCTLCADAEDMAAKNALEPFEYEYGDVRSLAPEEMEMVVERLSAPTFARQQLRCPKTPKPFNEVSARQRTPLASGLRRSKNVKEIVQRLYSANRFRYTVPPATQITLYT